MPYIHQEHPLYDLYLPKTDLIGFISVPHAGTEIPEVFKEFLTTDDRAIAEDVDFRAYDLFDHESLLLSGIGILVAKVHRVCLDLNRPPELACLNWKENTHGIPLVIKSPSEELEKKIVKEFHTPYFDCLLELLERGKKAERKIPVIDWHTMPSRPTNHHLKQNPNQPQVRPDLCISDLMGKSCKKEYIEFIMDFLTDLGLEPLMNEPYQGGYITKFLAPLHCENVQIEVNRALYMNEYKKELIPELTNQVRGQFTELILEVCQRF